MEGGRVVYKRFMENRWYAFLESTISLPIPPSLPPFLPSSGSPSRTFAFGHSATPRSGSTRPGAGRGIPEEEEGREGGGEGGRERGEGV